jgi:hypothetical protein
MLGINLQRQINRKEGGGGGGRNLKNSSWAIDLDDFNFFKLKLIWLKKSYTS